MKISEPVMVALEAARTDGNGLFLAGELDRKLYVEVNKVIEAIGGKWSRGLKCHLFAEDAAEMVQAILETGEYTRTKQDLGQFDSPPAVVERIIELAGDLRGKCVLEPSAGIGNLVLAALKAGAESVDAYEIDAKREAQFAATMPYDLNWSLHREDFLATPIVEEFDVVLMNPPFAKQADIEHVRHAYKMLKPQGGRLVSVMSAGALFRQNGNAQRFRDFVDRNGGHFERLPDDSFKASGTSVTTCLLVMEA